ARVRRRPGRRRTGAARPPALAVDGADGAAARRPGVRRRAAGRGDRRRGALDEPAVAHSPAGGALRPRGRSAGVRGGALTRAGDAGPTRTPPPRRLAAISGLAAPARDR